MLSVKSMIEVFYFQLYFPEILLITSIFLLCHHSIFCRVLQTSKLTKKITFFKFCLGKVIMSSSISLLHTYEKQPNHCPCGLVFLIKVFPGTSVLRFINFKYLQLTFLVCFFFRHLGFLDII